MANEKEDYLDKLLNSVVNKEVPQEDGVILEQLEEDIIGDDVDRKERKKRNGSRRRKNEEDFLDEFEKELDAFEADQIISDYEMQLEEDMAEDNLEVQGLERSDIDKTKENFEDSFFEGLGDAMNQADEESIVSNGILPDEDVSLDESESSMEEEVAEEPVADNDDDILSLLNGLGEEDSDLADIGQMLQADENHEAVGTDDAGLVAESLAELGFDVDPGDMDELSSIKEREQMVEDNLVNEEKQSGKKSGLLSKLKNLFFGPDEEEEQKREEVKTEINSELEGISDENLDILKALEGHSDAPAKEEELDPKAKKKAEKEAKKKEREEKKEAKKAEKEAKKKEKAEKKAAKPKKEKKPKVKDNTPPLPKLPVFLVFLMVASFSGAIIFAGNGVFYHQSVRAAEDAYAQGDYTKAFKEIAGVKMRKKQQGFYDKVMVLAGMQELLESYETLRECGREELALDCLIRVIGHYDKNIDKAGEAGYSAEISKIEKEAEDLLKAEYKVSYEKALKLYGLRSRKKYSEELYKILFKEGIV